MRHNLLCTLALLGTASLAVGQAPGPTTRASTAGTIAPTAKDVVPLPQGATVPQVSLVTDLGRPFDLHTAVTAKPTVLVFYRGGWCQNCTRQLRGLQSALPQFADAGFGLIAISPDKPESARLTVEKLGLEFPVLSDRNATATRAFGLAYQGAVREFAMLEQASGATHHVLAAPAIYVIGTDGKIRFAHVDPDSTARITVSELLERAKASLQQ